MDLKQVLQNARNQDPQIRGAAEAYLREAEETQLGPFMVALVGELSKDENDLASRQLAGLHFKNMLRAEDEGLAEQKKKRWLELDEEGTKTNIRGNLLQNLLSAEKTVRHTAAQCIGAVAAIDIPYNAWGQLVEHFKNLILSAEVAEESKESTLEACGYMCEELEEGALSDQQTNEVLTSIVDGMKPGRPETTRCAAVIALDNSLKFCRRNFDVDDERNVIMQNLCEACQSANMQTRVKALECLGRIAELYYKHLPAYMQAIWGLTTVAIQQSIQGGDEDIGKAALEFWSLVCEEEMELNDICEGHQDNHNFIGAILEQKFTEYLFECMKKQDDDEDSVDNFNLASAAAVCLENIAKTVGDDITNHVFPFVSQNIDQPDWRLREAATMAFGMILDGPQDESGQFKALVKQAVPQFVAKVQDPSVFVKDTAVWTLARICEIYPYEIPVEIILAEGGLVARLLVALDDVPRVAEKACTCIHHMAEMSEEIGGAQWFGQAFLQIVQKLFGVTEREDSSECDLRAVAYEAISMMIENHTVDARTTVLQMVPELFKRLQDTFKMKILSQNDKMEQDQLQALLVATLHITIRSLDENDVKPIADPAMQLFLQVLMTKNSTASEEAFMAVGAVADKMEEAFQRYLQHLMPVVYDGLQNFSAFQACKAAVGLVGDIARACPEQLLLHCDNLIQLLSHILQSPELKREVKPPVLSLLGDLAIACGGNYDKYLDHTMPMLMQAAATQVEGDDEEILEFFDELREGVLDAYLGIVNGLDGPKVQLLLQPTNYVQPIFHFIELIANDENKGEDVTKLATNLLGDLARCLGKPIAAYFQNPGVQKLLEAQHEIEQNSEDNTGELASRYATKEIKALFASA